MAPSARENYLTTETMTATPQKLQLLLIEAALRSARRADRQWRDQQDEQALESVIHAQAVMGELLRGVDQQSRSELTDRVAAVYAFIFRRLAEAGYRQDRAMLADAIRLLEIERETWQAGMSTDGDAATRRSSRRRSLADPSPHVGPHGQPGVVFVGRPVARGVSHRGADLLRLAPSDRPAAAGSPYLHLRKVLNAALRRQPYPSRPTEPTPSKASVEGSGVGVGVY